LASASPDDRPDDGSTTPVLGCALLPQRERMTNMAKLTPEQEAAYALDYNLNRDELKPEVQAEYDRLKKKRQDSAGTLSAAAEASRRAAAEAAAQIAAKKAKPIPMSTTDTLPPAFGGDREIKRMELVEVWGYKNPQEAEDAVRNWAQMNDYDAVVGVRILGIPDVIGGTVPNGLASGTRTEFYWALYGTAIGWSDLNPE
jgi:hypothetical protein